MKSKTTMLILGALVLISCAEEPVAQQAAPQPSAPGYDHHVDDSEIPGLIKQADRVLLGTVVSSSSQFETNEFGDRLIITRARVITEEMIKGSMTSSVEVAVEGGTVGDLTLEVSHTPSPPEAGDRALFILSQRSMPLGEEGILAVSDSQVRGSQLDLDDIRSFADRQ